MSGCGKGEKELGKGGAKRHHNNAYILDIMNLLFVV